MNFYFINNIILKYIKIYLNREINKIVIIVENY